VFKPEAQIEPLRAVYRHGLRSAVLSELPHAGTPPVRVTKKESDGGRVAAFDSKAGERGHGPRGVGGVLFGLFPLTECDVHDVFNGGVVTIPVVPLEASQGECLPGAYVTGAYIRLERGPVMDPIE
jgi:hypothetical protein